ncbi:hypothetical protein P3X46_019135 [Hevea brasiliensis]|uniref:Late embryogenesis abundant protein LEA-2 subgroup domain-containing protein n=1 Tax=Hevea brasiliensis TaxID=3981 RepID=A0ABQ9LV33_HEVBR|nr:NDR1/HIN1-like protein 6 [Hevea brasiliensis]KAJ9171087.1 hypothetical protein P3X46_019135 [Hevea brasiliensis]
METQPPYQPKYVMLNSNHSTNLRPPPKRRNIPRYHSSHPGKSSGSCCLKCLCCCFLFWFALIILLGGAAFYLYSMLQPEIPRYNVDRFDVNAFNVQQDFSLHTEFVVTVKSDNPNQHIGFQYGKDSSVVVTYKDSVLCAGKLPAFLQPHSNTTMIQILLKGDSEFGSGLQEALMQNRKSGQIPLLVEVKAPISVVIRDFPMRQVTVLLNCSLVVDNLSPKKKARILSSTYHYAVEL